MSEVSVSDLLNALTLIELRRMIRTARLQTEIRRSWHTKKTVLVGILTPHFQISELDGRISLKQITPNIEIPIM